MRRRDWVPPTQDVPHPPPPSADLRDLDSDLIGPPAQLNAEQRSRGLAALAIGWQHPDRRDPPEEHTAWWDAADQLAAWINTGERP